MDQPIRVKEVYPIADMLLCIIFENGVKKKYNVRQLIPQFPIYEALENRALFNMANVDCGGCAISWNSDVDISECELWENGVEIL